MEGYRSLRGQLTDLAAGTVPTPPAGKTYHWEAVANAALAEIIRTLYPGAPASDLAKIDSLAAAYESRFAQESSQAIVDDSWSYGTSVAEAIAAYARSDGQEAAHLNNFPASYVPPTGPGLWIPTPGAYQPAL
ncbi:MAG: hypothetical protein OHK0039_33560 [Bacteroidia bacterium]